MKAIFEITPLFFYRIKTIILLFIVFSCFNLFGQGYRFENTTSAYVPLSSGDISSLAGAGDLLYDNQDIGFAFNYGGVSKTKFSIHSNGFIVLDQYPSGSFNNIYGSVLKPDNGTSSYGFSNVISGASSLQVNYQSAFLTSSFSVKTVLQGSAPNRVRIIQYDHINLCGLGIYVDFQIRLYETSNKIEIIYNNPSADMSLGVDLAIGIKMGDGGSYGSNTYALTGSGNWNELTKVDYSYVYAQDHVMFNSSSQVSSGKTLRFTPVSCTFLPPSVTSVTYNAANISIAENLVGASFQLFKYDVNGEILISSENFSTTLKTLNNLEASTKYKLYVEVPQLTGCPTLSSTQLYLEFTTKALPPVISYPNNIVGVLNSPITPLSLNNTGSVIPAPINNFGKVQTLALTGTTSIKPMGMVIVNGDKYVCDGYYNRILKINSSGVSSVFAGSASQGNTDGTGTAARFNFPSGISTDGSGNLYVADRGNHKIRKIVISTGVVTTIVGSTTNTSGSINGVGTVARFTRPTDVKFRNELGVGYLYVVDSGNNCIRKVKLSDNSVSTFAGVMSTTPSAVVNGALLTATFKYPTTLVFDDSDINNIGIIYVVDRGNTLIRKISFGQVSTFAGNSTNDTIDGNGTSASFADPYGIEVDGQGNLYVSQARSGGYPTDNPGFEGLQGIIITWWNGVDEYIRKITPDGNVSIFAGTGVANGAIANNQDRLLATFLRPSNLYFDSSSNMMYVSEVGSDDIRTIQMSGYEVSPSLPTGLSLNPQTGNITGTPTVATNSTFEVTGYNYYGSSKTNLTITTGNLPTFTTQQGVISFNSTTVLFSSTVSGTGGIPLLERGICWSTSPNPTINDNKVNETTLSGLFSSTVSGLQKNTTYYFKAYAKNAIGTSYTNTDLILKTFADKPTISYPSNTILSKNSTIQPVVPTITGGAVASETFSSNFASVTGQSLHLDGTLATCSFRGVNDLAKDSQGNIYTVSYHDHYIRKITPQGNVTVLAGTENTPGSTNGNISIATFNNPSGIVVDSNDNIFITDLNNNIIRKITPSGVVTTFATGFSGPYGIAIDVSNNLYVSEITANKIKKITPAGIVTVLAGSGTATFADGQGSLASFKDPRQLDVDVNGNIYVADSGNSRVRMITPSGMVSTIAGDGNTAVLNSVSTLALDNFGNIYVGDNSYKIKKITPSRAIVVIAGSGTYGSTNGIGSTSTFTNPACLYFDKDSNYIYIGFTSVPNSIRRLSLSGYDIKPSLPTGLVFNNSTGQITGTPSVNSLSTLYTVIAYNSGGSSTSTFNLSVVNSPLVTTTSMFVNSSTATLSSQITDDSGLAISAKGICWSVSNQNPTVSDNTLSGGTGLGSYSSFINSLSPSTTYYARAYVTNTNGTYYSSTISFTTLALAPSIIYDNVPELYVNASSVNISVSNTGGQVAANEQFISLGLNSLSTANTNAKAVVKNIATGDLFVLWGNEIKRVTPQGIITTYATDFNLPEGMSISSTGELYVANTGSNNIIKVVNGVKSVFAGSVSGLSGNILSTGQLARFNQPTAITIDSNNNLYIVDGGNSSIKKVSLSDQSVIQIINNTNFFYAKGITYGKIKRPNNYIGTDRVVNCLFISSSAYHKVLVFPLENNNNNNDIYTIGNGSVSSIDGSQTSCSFSNPRGIVSTVCGIVYVTDFSTGKLRKIIFDDVNSAYVSTISTNSNLINPNGISCDSSALLIADSSLTTNNRISKVSLSQYSICPNLPAGLQFNQSSGLISGIPTQLTDPTTYTITGYNAGGISATNVNLSVIPVPTITADSIQYLCATAKVSDIVVNGAQLNGVLKYYTIPGFNSTPKQELVSSTQIVNGQHYFITQVVNNFESLPTEVQVQFSNIIDTNITSITEFNINSNQKRYSVNPISGTSYYKWSLPSGFVVTSESQSGNQITVTIPSDFVSSDGVITVQAFGPCNGSAIISRTLTSVTPIVTQTGDIGCSGTATVSYSVDPVANSLYSWTLPTGMSIISNNNNQIQVNVASGFTSGNVQVGISNSNSTVTSRLAVARANSPVVINGSRNICSLSSTTYSVAPVAGATSYVWSVPTGMTITGGSNTETISVSINESLFTSGNISVFAVTNCGNSASRTLSVSKAVEPSAISGPKDICSNKTKVYSIDSSGNITSTTEEDYVIYATGRIIGANNVQWSVPTGSTLVSGQGTYIAAINFDANTYTGGAISFTNLSNCIGTSPVKTLAVTKGNPVITGPTNLCGLSIAVYSIPNSGTNFNWIVPSWMTITNGQGTNEITVSFTKLCTTDSVSVSFTSVCGSSSTPTTITKTGIGCSNYSSLATTSCGITLSTFDQTLTSVPVANATSYRFNVDDGISIRQYTSTTKTFKLTNLTGVLLQNTQYSVSVDVLVSGTWYEGGCYCFVTTPTLPTTSIQSSQCGVTLSSYVTPISADAVTIATKYKFRVVEGTNQDVTYESTSRQILLTDVVGLTLSNNTTYQISVAVLIDGRWSSFGSTCSITMPDALTTSLIPSMCNGSLVSLASFITANNITGATSYKFKVVGGTINATYINTTRQFKLTDLPNQVVDLGTTYEVSVSVGQNGQYHSYGPACTVSTPALSKVIVSQCGSTLPALNTSITADLISGATQYKFKVYGGLIDTEYISPNSTRVFKLTDIPNVTLQFGTTYQVSVSVRINNKWSAYGLICNINTPVSLYTTLISAHCNSTLALLDSYITANNVAGATSYRFKVIGGSINTEYVSSTRQFKLTDIPNQVVDFGTTYQVSVAVGQDGYYHNYGHICSVTTPSLPQIITPQCGTTLSTFGDNITANLISAATKYKFKVVVPGADPFYYESNIRVLKLSDLPSAFVNTYYDYGSSTFQTRAFRYNTPFEVSVSVFVNGSWSNYGNVCQLTSPNKVNIPIQSSYCGQTINSPCDKIYANISNLPAIESFRFVLGNGSSNQWGGVYDTTNNWCSFNDFTSFQNNNNYSLYVEEVKINGIWYDADISSSCSITSPVAVTTSIVQCGTSLTSFDSLIQAVSLPNATQYKFKVINPYNYMYYEHVSSLNSFKLTDISGSNFDYNTPYLISVAVKISDCWQRFSQVCQISTPQEPVSQLVSSYCDSVLNSLDQTIYANPVYGALNYRFELLDHDGYPYSYTTSNPYFKLTDFNGLAYPYNVSKIFNAKYNTSYTIHVSVNGGVFSNDCIIYTPKVKVKNSLCGVTLSSYYDNIQTNSASFIGITKYKFEITYSDPILGINYDQVLTYETTNRYFKLQNVPGLLIRDGVDYQVRVAVQTYNNNAWSPFGDVCTVSTPFISSTTSVVQGQCGSVLANIDDVINLVQVTNATKYRVYIYSDLYTSGDINTATFEILTPSFKLSDIDLLSIYANKTYSIMVAALINNRWMNYGNVCTITTPQTMPTISILPIHCNQQFNDLNEKIYCENIGISNLYRFNFIYGSLPQYYSIDTTNNWITLADIFSITGGGYNYNESVTINVQYKYRNADNSESAWSDIGSECVVLSPHTPHTNLLSNYCNNSYIYSDFQNNSVTVAPISGALAYSFKVTKPNGEVFVNTLFTWYRTVPNEFNLGEIFDGQNNVGLYLIQVAPVTESNYSNYPAFNANDYGDTCLLTLYDPYAKSTNDVITKDEIKDVDSDQFGYKASAYPNPFSENYSLIITSESISKITLKVYDISGRLIESREVSMSDLASFKFGESYTSGVYTLVVQQDSNVCTLKMIKK